MHEGNDGGGGMKWLIWSPAVAIFILAAAFPGGLILFALPLLALGYLLIALVAISGRADDPRPARARSGRHTSGRTSDE